jgi:putative glutamine amidotransferase
VAPDRGHEIRAAPGSLLESLLGAIPNVSSLHHQAVDRLGVGWRATARAGDGVLDAVGWIGEATWPAIGFQWHPELDATGPALFGWLVERAAAKASTRQVRHSSGSSPSTVHEPLAAW